MKTKLRNKINTKAFSFSIMMLSYAVILTLIIVISILLSKISGLVPMHWSPNVGIDKWGEKKDMVMTAMIIPVLLGMLFNCGSIICHKFKQYGVSVLLCSLVIGIEIIFGAINIFVLSFAI